MKRCANASMQYTVKVFLTVILKKCRKTWQNDEKGRFSLKKAKKSRFFKKKT